MAEYAYFCPDCRRVFSLEFAMGEAPERTPSVCGETGHDVMCERVYTAPALHLNQTRLEQADAMRRLEEYDAE